MSNVSLHAKKRIRERIGVGSKSVDRQASLALERGLSHGEMKGRLYKWTTSVVLKYRPYPIVKLFNMKLFLFSEKNTDSSVLITVIPVPSNLHKQVQHQLHKQLS